MNSIAITLAISSLATAVSFAQGISDASHDSTQNHLVFPPDYKTVEYGAIPEYRKAGKGKETLILIPGWGFDASVFDDFIEANRKRYTMIVITLPGMGSTAAQPMPKEGISYGELTWTKGVLEGLKKLMDKEKISKAIFVGHFTHGVYFPLKMAIDYPDRVRAAVVLGGQVKFVGVQDGKPRYDIPVKQMIAGVDRFWAPKFYKTIRKSYFDDNNYEQSLYSVDTALGDQLWKQSADVSLSVMIRYLCEFYCTDITAEFEAIKCPVLILRPGFDKNLDKRPAYFKSQFIDSWDLVKNYAVEVHDIPNSGTFLWKDKPFETYHYLNTFIRTLKY